ncbi:hypothetical protein ABE347_06620 [Bacillus paralicheniformis]|uniref:hypothetical protein n=1 Tax=Bacillus paralicheniformis TaxID=1648923 RepID=UPI003D25586E
MAEIAKVLINKTPGRMTINFLGAFPQNKWTNKENGKIYLTEKEWEWVQTNIPHVLEKGFLIEEGSVTNVKTDSDKAKEFESFFKQHVNKAKAQIAKMDDLDEINALIDYANDHEIDNKAVDALVERANELGE